MHNEMLCTKYINAETSCSKCTDVMLKHYTQYKYWHYAWT